MKKNRLITIMPMAGEGKRFKDNNYKLIKPLIKINNKAMFLNSLETFPSSDLMVIIFKDKSIKNFIMNKNSQKYFKKKCLDFLPFQIFKKTRGQAETCIRVNKIINKNDEIFIHSCDSYFIYSKKKLNILKNYYDIVIFVTKSNSTHHMCPNQYGWINIVNNKINNISCKKIASQNYKKDYIIVGSFYYKNKDCFEKPIKEMIKTKSKINNEYYLDTSIMCAIKLNYKVGYIKVSKYKSWGTPTELNLGKI